MNISISNIAWDKHEDEQVIELLKEYGVNKIDIAPSKYFSDFRNLPDKDILEVKNFWQTNGIELIGMQSLLFGTQGLNIFADDFIRDQMIIHLEQICRIGALLNATKLVFGSPKNRDITGVSEQKVRSISKAFFSRLGDIAEKYHCTVCLEPNPICYGANFMLNSTETLDVVKIIDHPAIKMQLDLGSITINQEDINEVLAKSAAYIGHIHISEPELNIIGSSQTTHNKYAQAIATYLPEKILTIEMRPSEENHLASIEQALRFVREYYQ